MTVIHYSTEPSIKNFMRQQSISYRSSRISPHLMQYSLTSSKPDTATPPLRLQRAHFRQPREREPSPVEVSATAPSILRHPDVLPQILVPTRIRPFPCCAIRTKLKPS